MLVCSSFHGMCVGGALAWAFGGVVSATQLRFLHWTLVISLTICLLVTGNKNSKRIFYSPLMLCCHCSAAGCWLILGSLPESFLLLRHVLYNGESWLPLMWGLIDLCVSCHSDSLA